MAAEEHVKEKVAFSSTTLFARNLPFTTDSKELEKVFSDVGPVKRCFVVKDKENPGKCRGFGYVTFAIKEDAAKAKENIKSVNGRKVFLTFSNKKPRHKQRNQPEEIKSSENGDNIEQKATAEEAPPPQKPLQSIQKPKESIQKPKRKPKSERSAAGNNDGRTVVLSGFPSTVNVKQLKKACKRIGEVEQFTYPMENYEKPTAHAVFASHKLTRIAVKKLNGKTVKGSVLSAVLCSKVNKKDVSVKSLKKSRLIVRNLPFKCSREMLVDKFSKFGEISEVVLPSKMVGEKTKKLGFAFVQFKTVFDAAKALEAMNQKEIKGRPIAVDWTLPKKKYELFKVSEDVEKDKNDEQLTGDEGEDQISKEAEDLHDSSAEEAPTDEQETGEESEAEEDIGDDEDQSDDDGHGEDDQNDKLRTKKRKLRDAREGKTIFIRNLPFDASEEEICGLFEKFGKISYCKIVVDHIAEHSKGSAFVKFEEKQSADECVNKCNMDDDQNEISLRNRPLNINLAVTKSKVPQLLAERDSAKKSPRDKRNLYLAKEGLILPGSQTATDLSKADLQKRRKAEAEKKAKLKMPHFIVSKTRLCFRNLPLNVDNKKLAEVLRTICDGKPKKVGKVNIMRSNERLDSSGTGRSKGFGFVELSTHEDALEVLRETNNNPKIFGPDRRPIVEFAIENSLILKRQEQRKLKSKQKLEESKGKQKDNEQNQRESGNEKGQKRKRGRKEIQGQTGVLNKRRSKDAQACQENTDGLGKKQKIPRKSEETGKTVDAKITLHRGVDSKIKSFKGNYFKNSKVNRSKDESSSRSRHKEKEKANKEEENFNKIVEKYKSKLFGDNTKQLKASRWFQ